MKKAIVIALGGAVCLGCFLGGLEAGMRMDRAQYVLAPKCDETNTAYNSALALAVATRMTQSIGAPPIQRCEAQPSGPDTYYECSSGLHSDRAISVFLTRHTCAMQVSEMPAADLGRFSPP